MKEIIKPRLYRLNIRLSQEEWDKIHAFCSNTTCRSVSEYSRKVLLNQPVRVFYRNQSFDDFEQQMIVLLGELQDFGDDFEEVIEVLKTKNMPDIFSSLLSLQTAHENFVKKTAEIKELITKLNDKCAQE